MKGYVWFFHISLTTLLRIFRAESIETHGRLGKVACTRLICFMVMMFNKEKRGTRIRGQRAMLPLDTTNRSR